MEHRVAAARVQAPFGGIVQSGDSREGGRLGLEEHQDVQYLSVNFD